MYNFSSPYFLGPIITIFYLDGILGIKSSDQLLSTLIEKDPLHKQYYEYQQQKRNK